MKNKEYTLSKDVLALMEQRLKNLEKTLNSNEDEEINFETSAEIADSATRETMLELEIKKSGRKNQVLNEIKNALKKIREGTYGICEESGEPISIKRLKANPLARYSIEMQREMENKKNPNKPN